MTRSTRSRSPDDTPDEPAAAVWTADLARGRRIARRRRAARIWVNTYDAADMATPFGGMNASGFGHDRSPHALDSPAQPKTTWMAIG